MKVRKFRILRLRHHVSMVELGRACGVSAQRISELELSENKPSACSRWQPSHLLRADVAFLSHLQKSEW